VLLADRPEAVAALTKIFLTEIEQLMFAFDQPGSEATTMTAEYQRGQSSIQRDASGCTRLGRHTHKAGTETAPALGFPLPNDRDQWLAATG